MGLAQAEQEELNIAKSIAPKVEPCKPSIDVSDVVNGKVPELQFDFGSQWDELELTEEDQAQLQARASAVNDVLAKAIKEAFAGAQAKVEEFKAHLADVQERTAKKRKRETGAAVAEGPQTAGGASAEPAPAQPATPVTVPDQSPSPAGVQESVDRLQKEVEEKVAQAKAKASQV